MPRPPRLARNVEEALAIAQSLPGDVFVCGGERIFQETLPLAERIYLTLIQGNVEGDVYFPEWRHLSWCESYRHESQDSNYRYSFSILQRTRG